MIDIQNYKDYTDKYFIRSRYILEKENINPIVRFQIFTRQNFSSIKGIKEVIDFIKSISKNIKIYAFKENESYIAGEPILKLEGRIQDLIELETIYLSILSKNLNGLPNLQEIKKNANSIRKAAKDKKVFYFGARHFPTELDEEISKICFEAGFTGCSTNIGGKAWKLKGIGTIPHALVLTYAVHIKENNLNINPTSEVAKAFDKHISKEVPRLILVDTFNREIEDSILSAKLVKNLNGVRVDTCGEIFGQGYSQDIINEIKKNKNIELKYLEGRGVKITGIWALRRALDDAGFHNLEITVSSGFNEKKIKSFIEADIMYHSKHKKHLFNSIGTGSLSNISSPTSDIIAYFSEKKNKWVNLGKNGRSEIQTNKLNIVE